jgi:Uma2 family endonuclease
LEKEIGKMAVNPQRGKITVEEYFQLDSDPSNKYEYIDGYAVTMSANTVGQSRIAQNIVLELDRQLESGPCEIHTSNIRVHIAEYGNYVFPDATVSCEASDNQMDTEVLHSPRLVVEVLSPSTELYDRGSKFLMYQTLPSLQEYVLVSSRYQFVEIYRRQADDTWTYQTYRPEQLIKLESLGLELTFEEIYERVPVPAKPELLM